MPADDVAKQIAMYVHRGLRVVRLYSVAKAGTCSCWKGASCDSPGKHTTGAEWQMTTDEDQVFEWWGGAKTYNVGVVLGNANKGTGPAVIDIEADSDEADAEIRRLGLDRFETPTWRSSRGLHRLFLWNPSLPNIAVVKPNGVEVRIGGDRQAQSVMPPSRHHSGGQYRWEAGLGLEDVAIAPIPDNVMEAIAVAENKPRSAERKPVAALLVKPVNEGERNEALFRFACLLVRAIPPGDDASEQATLALLRSANATQMHPPLSEAEVVSIWRSAMKYRREQLATDCLFPGVEAVVDGTRTVYRPAGMELTIYRGDPTTFELRCDALKPYSTDGTVRVEADVWCDYRKMKTALVAAFPGVPFDRHPGDFKNIWDGLPPEVGNGKRRSNDAVIGLRLRLEQEANAAGRRVEVIDPTENRLRRWIGVFAERLAYLANSEEWRSLQRPGGDQYESEQDAIVSCLSTPGGLCTVASGIWLSWERVWQSLERQMLVKEADKTKVALGVPKLIGRQWETSRVQWKGRRVSAKFLSMHELLLLRDYGSGATPPCTTACPEISEVTKVREVVAAVARAENVVSPG